MRAKQLQAKKNVVYYLYSIFHRTLKNKLSATTSFVSMTIDTYK